jgi:hypothetical protein
MSATTVIRAKSAKREVTTRMFRRITHGQFVERLTDMNGGVDISPPLSERLPTDVGRPGIKPWYPNLNPKNRPSIETRGIAQGPPVGRPVARCPADGFES